MWRMKRCNNFMLVTYKSFFFSKITVSILLWHLCYLLFFLWCQNTIFGQLRPWLMWKLHFFFFFKKCYLDKKKGVSLNAINETILSCLCMSVLSPTLCYDMHREFHSWSESFNLHLHLEKMWTLVNVDIVVQVVSAVQFVFTPTPILPVWS